MLPVVHSSYLCLCAHALAQTHTIYLNSHHGMKRACRPHDHHLSAATWIVPPATAVLRLKTGLHLPSVAEHLLHVIDIGGIPFTQRLVKFPRTIEHGVHISDAGCIPLANGLVELICINEHPVHGGRAGSIPFTNWLVEIVHIKHRLHGRDSGSVPIADGHIKFAGFVKHALHGCNARGVPVCDGHIKFAGFVEHEGRVCNAGCVPMSDELIKFAAFLKHGLHGCNAGGVPVCNGHIKFAGFVEHEAHVHDATHAPMFDVMPFAVLDLFEKIFGAASLIKLCCVRLPMVLGTSRVGGLPGTGLPPVVKLIEIARVGAVAARGDEHESDRSRLANGVSHGLTG